MPLSQTVAEAREGDGEEATEGKRDIKTFNFLCTDCYQEFPYNGMLSQDSKLDFVLNLRVDQ